MTEWGEGTADPRPPFTQDTWDSPFPEMGRKPPLGITGREKGALGSTKCWVLGRQPGKTVLARNSQSPAHHRPTRLNGSPFGGTNAMRKHTNTYVEKDVSMKMEAPPSPNEWPNTIG